MTMNITTVKEKFSSATAKGRRYAVPVFLLLLLAIYGFLAWRVVSLNQAQPDPTVVTTKLQSAGVPHIDQDVLAKIRQLQDNSVEVQSLFDQARSNPFQE